MKDFEVNFFDFLSFFNKNELKIQSEHLSQAIQSILKLEEIFLSQSFIDFRFCKLPFFDYN